MRKPALKGRKIRGYSCQNASSEATEYLGSSGLKGLGASFDCNSGVVIFEDGLQLVGI